VGAASLQKEILKNRHHKRRKIRNIEGGSIKMVRGVRVGSRKETYAREISTQFKEQLKACTEKINLLECIIIK